MKGNPTSSTPRLDPAFLAWNTVASFESHDAAQAAVGRLAEANFPIEHLDLVGSDVRVVERVTGRITRGRAALAGAAGGVWTGLLMGLLFSLFATGAGVAAAMLAGLLVGAATGAALGVAGLSGARGARLFASRREVVAARYDLVARDGFVDQARTVLEHGEPLTV